MADPKNPGQFGNRKDTKKMASLGGQHQGKENNPANFANDHEKAERAGRAGGSKSRRGSADNS